MYNSWALIEGSLVPEGARLFFYSPLWRNVFENTLTVQFDHRMAAYALALLALLHAGDVARTLRGGAALTAALALASALILQPPLRLPTPIPPPPLPVALLSP